MDTTDNQPVSCSKIVDQTDDVGASTPQSIQLDINRPLKKIYCSDGVLEVFDDEDEDGLIAGRYKLDADGRLVEVNTSSDGSTTTSQVICDKATNNGDGTDKQMLDPKNMPWLPFINHIFWSLGSRTLEVCDYVGEGLASFFGITSPKYEAEIDEYNRQREQLEAERRDFAGWTVNDSLARTSHHRSYGILRQEQPLKY